MEPRIPRYVPVVNVVLKFLTRRGVKAGPVSIITGAGTLTSGRTTTRVRLTEVTDPALKERVMVAFGTENRGAGSFLKQIGVAPERTPEGFAAAVPHVAVFEVTTAGA
jgi:hypothetical protein